MAAAAVGAEAERAAAESPIFLAWPAAAAEVEAVARAPTWAEAQAMQKRLSLMDLKIRELSMMTADDEKLFSGPSEAEIEAKEEEIIEERVGALMREFLRLGSEVMAPDFSGMSEADRAAEAERLRQEELEEARRLKMVGDPRFWEWEALARITDFDPKKEGMHFNRLFFVDLETFPQDEPLILTGPKRGLALLGDNYVETDLKIKDHQGQDRELSKGILSIRGIAIVDFMQEMSQRDKKVESLVSFGFPEGEAKMAITRCGPDADISVLDDSICASEAAGAGYSCANNEDTGLSCSSSGRRKWTKFMEDKKRKGAQGSGGPYKCEDPPCPRIQKCVLEECRKWNLVWVGRNKVAPLKPDEIEFLLGFPKDHTRGISRTERYRSLGNSFQVDTVAYHLSVLRDIYPNGLNVLSLFSGIGGAEVALHRLGIRMKTVVSVEKSKVNNTVLKTWWEQTQSGTLIEFADVKNVSSDWLESTIRRIGGFDLVIGGSPSSNLAGNNRYHCNGLEGEHSSLFYHYVRILDSVKSVMQRM
ncbi:DNA (cytosine-5)-methyltransferase DRM2 [Dichanthelium oligosanthes]|uniref:DNA (cytosine-5-)-methyltransferase n=1 Tax=Dichanthelium oligosanthes TaxID=888268 RepID=A0A1E5VI35_9POAL|nr:DNA (cytosine-5)-methyltransferase DRM2 [Dichanthelium oligosanthes]